YGTATATEQCRSDGTAAGTVLVKAFDPTGGADSLSIALMSVNGTLFFRGFDPANGTELWKSDGTAAGTVLVKDINPGSGGSGPDGLTNVNGTLFFRAFRTDGPELWKSDGTAAGTVVVREINRGTADPYARQWTGVYWSLLLTALYPVTGLEAW